MLKKIILFLVIGVLALLNLRIYLHAGFPYTHDGENHLARFANYKIAVKEGQIPPRFAPNLMNHYGYPVFNYNYPLANILSLSFSGLKLNYEISFKIMASFFVLMGLIGIYIWVVQLTKSSLAGLWSTVIFGTSPFLITTIMFRGNIGEIMALCLLPCILYLIEKIKAGQTKTGSFRWLMSLFFFTAFALSHNVTFVFGLPLIILYACLRLKKNFKQWMVLFSLLSFSGLLSFWFWLPALFEQAEIVIGGASLSNTFAEHFPTLAQLLFSPLQFGFSQSGSIDSLAFNLGSIQVISLVLATMSAGKELMKNRSIKNIQSWWLILIVVSWCLFGLQLSISRPLWLSIPWLRFIQFPWRLGLFFMIAVAGVGGHFLSILPKKGQLLICLIVWLQILPLLRLKAVDYFHRDNETYDAFGQSTSTANENLPRTFTYLNIGDWQPSPTIFSGNGAIKVEYWKGSDRQYSLLVNEKSMIIEPTMKFLGWETQIIKDGVSSKANYLDSAEIQGRIAYELAPGSYKIRTRFTQKTWSRMVGNGVSAVSLLGVLTIIILKRELRRKS